MTDSFKGVVYPWECDILNHMNVQFYVAKFDAASWHFMAELGLTPKYFQEEHRGMVAMEQRIRYFSELVAGDLVAVKSQLLEIRSKSLRFRHQMFNTQTDELAAEAEIIAVHINTITRKSGEFPAEIQANLKIHIDGKK